MDWDRIGLDRGAVLRCVCLCGLALAIVAGTAAGASAATPKVFTLAPAAPENTPGPNKPDLAVDGQGNAYVVWTDTGTNTIHFCKIPSRGTGCVVSQTFPETATLTGLDAHVLVGPAAGEVVVIDDGSPITDYVSMDGGTTFTPAPGGPGVAASQLPPEHGIDDDDVPAFGPGGFSFSAVSGYGDYQDVPLDGASVPTGQPPAPFTEYAPLFPSGCFSSTAAALVNSTTPIASCAAASGDISYRVYDANLPAPCAGDVNSASCWDPVRQIPSSAGTCPGCGLNETRMAGGARGVYSLYQDDSGNAQVSHLAASGTFAAPVKIAPGIAAVDGLSEDTTGNLYAAFTQPDGKGIGYTTSSDGVSWQKPVLLPIPAGGGARIAGCGPENGFVVFETGSGAVQAVSLGTGPCGGNQGSSSCPTHLTVGAAQLIATSGCFAKSGSTYSTSGGVELNGITIDPSAGASGDLRRAHGASAGPLVIDTVNQTIHDKAPALVSASSLALSDSRIDWALPSKGGALKGLNTGQIADLNSGAQPLSFDPSHVPSSALKNGIVNNLLDFPISSDIIPTLDPSGQAGKTLLPANIPIPSPVGGLLSSDAPTGLANLVAGNDIPGGLSLGENSVKIDNPDLWLGIAELKPFDIDYDGGSDTFDGHLDLLLPADPGVSVPIHLEFQHGKFVEGDIQANLGDSVPLYPDVFLSNVGLAVAARNGGCPPAGWTPGDGGSATPTYIGGSLGVAVGPIVPPAVLAIEGTASYTFPVGSCNEPGVFSINGDGSVFGFHVANANVNFTTDGNVTFGASFSIGDHVLGLSADVNGGVGIHKPFPFYASGNLTAYVAGVSFGPSITVSSIGIGGCANPIGYIEYKWSGSLSGGLLACDIGDLTPAGLGSSADARTAAAPPTVHVPAHDPAEEFVLKASSGAPLVKLTGPHGESVVTPAVPAGQPAAMTMTPAAAIAVVPSENETVIKLIKPSAGSWTITTLPGSPAITSLETGKGLPPAAVKAHVVTGKGSVRYLAYTSTAASGRSIEFVEKGHGVELPIARATTKARGRIKFLPAAGPAGRRTILAVVAERGLTVTQTNVASYVAPGPAKLARPGHVQLRRKGEAMTISWREVPGASRYVVQARLRDGRSLVLTVAKSKHAVTVRTVPDFDSGKVMVAALDPANRPGAIGTVQLRSVKPTCKSPKAKKGKLICAAPKPKHHHKHKRKK
jgi:hypothetical protein